MSQPIKIMRIIARLNVGGPAVHVALLTDKLSPPDFETQLVCGQIAPTEGDMSYLTTEKGIQPLIIPELGRNISPLRDIKTIFKLYRLMRQFRPDVVHTHTAKAGFVGRIAAWLARVPVRVHTFHGHVFHGYFNPLKTKVFLWLERFTARLSTRIITISPTLKDELVNTYHIGPAQKFIIVPLGLDLHPLATKPSVATLSQIRQERGIPASKKLIGIVGRLTAIKNHELFLEAVQKIAAQRDDLHFVIIGDGEERPNLEQSVKNRGLSEQVTFVGWFQDIGLILYQLDVLVNTSDNEGTPVSVIEAMVAKIPIVATAVGGTPDMLKDGEFGRLVPPRDSDQLVQAILETLENVDSEILSKAQTYALNRYDISRLVNDLAALYHDLLVEKGKR